MIEESDWDEAKNQVGAPPEPDVLMKYVECGDSNNEQDFFHGGQKVARPFGECQVLATACEARVKHKAWGVSPRKLIVKKH